MSFRESVAHLPTNNNQTLATGLLAPLIRAMGHHLYIVADMARDNPMLTWEDYQIELDHAKTHLAGSPAVIAHAPLSTAAKLQISYLWGAYAEAAAEFSEWPEDERGPNIKLLLDRTAALAATLDLELIGIPGSDGGRAL